MSIKADNLTWKIGRKTILEGVSLEAPPGRMLGLLGPNGSGKTSLLRLLAGLKRPHSGRVTLDRSDIGTISRRSIARRIAFVEQHATTNANLRVVDVVKLGRFPHRSMFSGWTRADEEAVEEALTRAGMAEKRDDRWLNLSGGEKQRTHIARALAQSPQELILDEPTNHLDIQHQIGLMRLVSGLPITSIVALHDLNHAAMFCDELIILQHGRIVASGAPQDVLSEELLKDVFSVEARIEASPYHSRPHIHYLR
ncbi:ABC transporter ATP-binding protein [Rhizobium laguerreae]|uniref:ABC transporter ATP-binding protein n=1 Tax=Rhizobium laguerreae TaxID=1076926 RepID=A0AAX2QIP3_9HYPH|nr:MULTISPECIES: ABC transporter ATP-binding protein [Rhizobium]MBN9984521.1 ABC transporter ATP-binding protein [Rhizobium laguerreae]MBY3035032.1 ABC transporter ATP-binding protein [Rhizobium laguerreae]MBY3065902.1 ABC transporter ATP-binding protein [Rhizobium laguerreae]MBY3073043.1 ABC transporter ATP-binding protein [Rhizobium laguerreae]MBY3078924.1 ABC transporter ATP-binding protein [Rhizobium laguerreae]